MADARRWRQPHARRQRRVRRQPQRTLQLGQHRSHHAAPKKGDVIVLWDTSTALGVSVIEDIERGQAPKERHSCPKCGKASFKARKTKRPRYLCFKCDHTFDKPISRTEEVTTYRTRHDAGWVDLDGRLTSPQLRNMCLSPASQLSLRPLDYSRFRMAIKEAPEPDRLSPMEAALTYVLSGHRTALVRVRRGQGTFRSKLIAEYGNECAFTGRAPIDALEAAHLYSYAATGRHHDKGGLLMRRDIHRLFDLGFLSVHPDSLQIDVSTAIAEFMEYSRLHGERVRPSLDKQQREWVRDHWEQHRPTE